MPSCNTVNGSSDFDSKPPSQIELLLTQKKNLGFFELGFSLKRNMILHFDKAISLLQCLSVGAVTVVKCPKIL